MLIRLTANHSPHSVTVQTPPKRTIQRFTRLIFLLVLATVAICLWLTIRYMLFDGSLEGVPRQVVDVLTLFGWAGALTIGSVWLLVAFRWWKLRRGGSVPLRSPDQLQALNPALFEQFVAGLFRQKGYEVIVRGRSGDLGVDLDVLNQQGRRAIVQCKRYRSTVGPDVVRELYGTMIHERAAHAFLVTTAEISDAAREWARGKPITLIDGALLVEIANNGRD